MQVDDLILVAAQLNDAETDLVTWQNTCHWYNFDPFAHRSRDACSVGTLRAQASDVDTTPREYVAADHTHNVGQSADTFLAETNSERG